MASTTEDTLANFGKSPTDSIGRAVQKFFQGEAGGILIPELDSAPLEDGFWRPLGHIRPSAMC